MLTVSLHASASRVTLWGIFTSYIPPRSSALAFTAIILFTTQPHSSHNNQSSALKYQTLKNQVCALRLCVCVCVCWRTCSCLLRALKRTQPECLRHADWQMRLSGFRVPHNSLLSIYPQGERTLGNGTEAAPVQGEELRDQRVEEGRGGGHVTKVDNIKTTYKRPIS